MFGNGEETGIWPPSSSPQERSCPVAPQMLNNDPLTADSPTHCAHAGHTAKKNRLLVRGGISWLSPTSLTESWWSWNG